MNDRLADAIRLKQMLVEAREMAKRHPDYYPVESLLAVRHGWDHEEFVAHYECYVRSTGLAPKTSTLAKGDPLEEVSRYLVGRSGFSTRSSSVSLHQVWQIDGRALLHHSNIRSVFGIKSSKRLGPSVLLEAKNYASAVGASEFNEHGFKLRSVKSRCGVLVSTHGFKLGGGRGIAFLVDREFYRGKAVHLLLAVRDLRAVSQGLPPLVVLREAYQRTSEEGYKVKKTRELYRPKSCAAVVESERRELASGALQARGQAGLVPVAGLNAF